MENERMDLNGGVYTEVARVACRLWGVAWAARERPAFARPACVFAVPRVSSSDRVT